MKTYKITIYKNNTKVDVQTVNAVREGLAKTRAMVQTKVHFDMDYVSYDVEEIA